MNNDSAMNAPNCSRYDRPSTHLYEGRTRSHIIIVHFSTCSLVSSPHGVHSSPLLSRPSPSPSICGSTLATLADDAGDRGLNEPVLTGSAPTPRFRTRNVLSSEVTAYHDRLVLSGELVVAAGSSPDPEAWTSTLASSRRRA